MSDKTEETHPPDQLSPLDRALYAEAILRTNLAARDVRDAQAVFAAARAAQNELAGRIAAEYGLADGDVANPESGAITRRSAAK